MIRIAIVGSFHESNRFVLEENDQPTAVLEILLHLGAQLRAGDPRCERQAGRHAGRCGCDAHARGRRVD
jgi:hypothetical protein